MAFDQRSPDLFIPPSAVPAAVHFRLAKQQDLRPLHSACYSQQPSYHFRVLFQRLLAWQESGRSYWVVAVVGAAEQPAAQIVGSGQLVIYPYGAELANLAVAAGYRGRGIGTAIVTILLAIARHIDLTDLEIGVTIHNPGALILYQRLGFVENRRLQLNNGESAIILHKAL